MKKSTCALLTISISGFLALMIISFFIIKENFWDNFRLGKDITVEITSSQTIDWRYINIDSEENSFDLLSDDTKSKLILFMKNNNLKIKAGTYEFMNCDYFQEIVMKLRFETIK